MSIYDDVRAMHIGFPRNYIALSRGYSSSHRGIDMCWDWDYGGPNAPVYAPYDGEVVATDDGWGNTYSSGVANWGNYVKIKHAKNVYTLSAHLLKGSLKVKVGDKVKRGQMIAQMNNSGYSNGNHVHFEIYIGGSGTGYREDPLKYCYAYPDDIIHPDEVGSVMRYTPIARRGTPVARNPYVDQVKITATTLRARKSPSLKGEIFGYANTGYYDCLGTTTADGYKWFHVEDFWVAQNTNGDWVEFFKAKEQRFDLTMKKLDVSQKDAMVAWCKESKVEYELKEV